MDKLTALISALGGRKFLLAVVVVVLVVFFVDIDPDKKLSMLTWIVGIYSGANVTQKAVVKQ